MTPSQRILWLNVLDRTQTKNRKGEQNENIKGHIFMVVSKPSNSFAVNPMKRHCKVVKIEKRKRKKT